VFDFPSLGNADASQITLNSTTLRSTLSIKGDTTIGDVVVSTPLGGLIAPTADLTGNFTAASSVARLQVRSAAGGDTLSATSFGNIVIRASLSDEIQTATLGHLTVGGALAEAAIRATSSIGSVLVASALASEIFAGVRPDLATLPTSAADLTTPTASLGSFTVRGHGAFSNTEIATGSIGAANLGAVQPDNAGAAFGLAAQRVKSVSFLTAGKPTTLHNPKTSTSLAGDALARIL